MIERSHPYHAPVRPPPPSQLPYGVAFGWGLAEALVFFIVPDVLLTRLALRDYRRAAIASLWAVLGALVGGTILWAAASQGHVQFLLNAFDWIPGISRELMVRTAQALDADGLRALLAGSFIGQPYKLFAVHAGAQEVPLLPFLAASVAARLARFFVTVSLAWGLNRLLSRLSETLRFRLHTYVWIAVYTCYFVLMR